MTGVNPGTAEDASPPRRKNIARVVVAMLALLVVGALFVEGAASLALLGFDFVTARAPTGAERSHTTHDTLLGWVNVPNNSSPDEYGPGVGLTTTALGFRGTGRAEASPLLPLIACSGDSFTLGYGVDDAHAWCGRLEVELPARTINLGQAAYGVDQAWLWYVRDGLRYKPRVHVVALNAVQFERALGTAHTGRFKPAFELSGGRLITRGVPVPPQTTEAFRKAYVSRLLEDLRFMQWLRGFDAFSGRQSVERRLSDRWPLFDTLLAQMARTDSAAGVIPALIYLPSRRDLARGPQDELRARISASARGHNLPFVDLTQALRAAPPDSQDNFFINRALPGSAPAVPGHYSNLGNVWAAHQVATGLLAVPGIAGLLGAAAPSSGSGRRGSPR